MNDSKSFQFGSASRPTELRDNGRRGEPLPGCDCVRCFGYCMVNKDEAKRATFDKRGEVK